MAVISFQNPFLDLEKENVEEEPEGLTPKRERENMSLFAGRKSFSRIGDVIKSDQHCINIRSLLQSDPVL